MAKDGKETIEINCLHGTQLYIAPEQIEGKKKMNDKIQSFEINPFLSDVYSIAIKLLEILGIDNVNKVIGLKKKEITPNNFKGLLPYKKSWNNPKFKKAAREMKRCYVGNDDYPKWNNEKIEPVFQESFN